MRTLLLPAVKLMDSLSYGKKFVVLGILSLLVVLLLVLELYGNLHQVYRDDKLELQGLQQIKLVSQMVQLVQQHRDLAIGSLAGIEEFQALKMLKQQEIDDVLQNLAHALTPEQMLQTKFNSIQELWHSLQTETVTTQDKAYQIHYDLIP